ncbi:3-deoxy-D-arabino-heptulosonate 7-phosphate synthase, partial [Burkholderia multivorans]
RLPPLARSSSLDASTNAATVIATVIEEARVALAAHTAPEAALQDRFVAALARMIRDAVDPHMGDPAFQAAVLRHDAPSVRDYAALSAHADQDRRALRSTVNTLAHP